MSVPYQAIRQQVLAMSVIELAAAVVEKIMGWQILTPLESCHTERPYVRRVNGSLQVTRSLLDVRVFDPATRVQDDYEVAQKVKDWGGESYRMYAFRLASIILERKKGYDGPIYWGEATLELLYYYEVGDYARAALMRVYEVEAKAAQ